MAFFIIRTSKENVGHMVMTPSLTAALKCVFYFLYVYYRFNSRIVLGFLFSTYWSQIILCFDINLPTRLTRRSKIV